ncbi:hypothetical protein, partial [Actinophytocola sp.]|uniref:hypothetical protein n=1 Tax=Actinophytocola sp. TaxID=1872138 RepID=UPI002D7F56BE
TPVLGAVGEIMLGSYTLPPDHPDAKIVADLHEQAVTVLGLIDGVTHLEILKCPRGYLVGEITCRPGGNGVPEQIRHQYGVDFWRSFLATSMGEDAGIATPPSARPGHLINFMLPRPVGTVTAITSAADLLALPGVEHAEVRTRVGDTTPAPLDSSVTAGTVLMRVDSEDEVPAGVARLAGRFRVEVAP